MSAAGEGEYERLDLDTELSVWLQRLKPSVENKADKQSTMQLVDLFSKFNLPVEFVNLLIVTANDGSLHEYLRNLSSLIDRATRHSQAPQTVHPSGPGVLPPIPLEERERRNLEELVSPQTAETLFSPGSSDMFEHTRSQVNEALRELMVITTHDDNLERQYKEVCAQCSKLFSDLDRAKREVFKLRGKISISEMTPERIRIEVNRQKEREAKAQQDRRTADEFTQILGERPAQRQVVPGPIPVTRVPKKRARHMDIPPPVDGCQCSVCKTVQGLGSAVLIPVGLESIQSGQQVMLGDRVIVRGQRPGTVRYLGKLEGHRTEIDNEVFAGVQLDHPVGIHNGTFNGKRYFSCPSKHGVFLPLRDVVCVTSRATVPLSNSLALRNAQRRQEADEKARRQHSMEQGQLRKELKELVEKHHSVEYTNVLSLEIPDERKRPANKQQQLRSSDSPDAAGEVETKEIGSWMDNLLQKSRSIYDETHPPHSVGNHNLQPVALSGYLRSAKGEGETGRQGRREVTISATT